MIQTVLYILIYALFNVSGAAFIKWQLKGKHLNTFQEWLQLIFNVPFMVSFVLIVLSALALFKALSTSNFSFIIPLATGINFILTILIGCYLFQDKLSIFSMLGFLLILGGIIILSINNHTHA